jgi:lysozyme family protein
VAKLEFPKALPRILVYEGGKVDDPHDPGGRTAYGITQGTYNAYRRKLGLPTQDVFLISNSERADIYKTMYWDKVHGDDLPMGLGLNVFDGAVNSGAGRSGIWLQQALGAVFTGQIDGQIGDKTLQAVDDFGDDDELIRAYCAHRLGTLMRLKNWKRYGKGWGARIANVQKTGIAWYDSSEAPHPVSLMDLGGHQKAIVQDNLLQPPISQMVAHLGTAAGSAGTLASSTATQLQAVGDTFKFVTYAIGGLTLAAVVAGVVVKLSADASAAADKGVAKASVSEDADAKSPVVEVDDAANVAAYQAAATATLAPAGPVATAGA